LSTLGAFGTGVDVCPIDISPSATRKKLLNRYEETQARLQKIRDAGYKVISIWGCEFRKLLCDNPDLKNELCSHPYVKYSPVNIRDAWILRWMTFLTSFIRIFFIGRDIWCGTISSFVMISSSIADT